MTTQLTLHASFAAKVAAVLDALELEGALPHGASRAGVTVEPPRDPAHGDLATNAAMVLAKPAATNPRALAERIVGSPGLSFRISGGRAKSIMHELRYGETWLAFDYEPAEAQGYRSEMLSEDPYVVVARPGNAHIGKDTTLEQFEALEQVAFMSERDQGPSPLTQRLERHGVKRRIKYAVPSLVSVAAVAAASDLIGVMPKRVARGLQRTFDIVMHPCPFDLPPMQIYMVWHENFDIDEGHIWMRGVLREIAQTM